MLRLRDCMRPRFEHWSRQRPCRGFADQCDCLATCSWCDSEDCEHDPLRDGPAFRCRACHRLTDLDAKELAYVAASRALSAPPRAESLATLDREVADAAQRSQNWVRSLSRAHDEADGALCEPDASDPNMCAICRCALGTAVAL